MKKLMSVSLILLPLILLLILSINTTLVSLTTYIYVENVEILDSENALYLVKGLVGDDPTFQLETNVFPMRASNKDLIYRSDDENIASINGDGLITGNDFGATYVRAISAENNTKYAMRKVIVTDENVHELKIANPIQSLEVGKSYDLDTKVIPEDARDKTLIYESSNPDAIVVSFSGRLTAKERGVAEITVTSQNNPDAVQKMTIHSYYELQNASVDGDLSRLTLAGDAAKFPGIVLDPKNARAVVEYSSDNEKVAVVGEDGNISFKSPGEVVIRAEVNDKFAFEKRYVYTAGCPEDVQFTGRDDYAFEDFENKPLDIGISVFPADCDKDNVRLSTSNENVVRIEDGEFHAAGGGQATISAGYKTYSGSERTITKTVNISRKVDKIEIEHDGIRADCFFTQNDFIIDAVTDPADSTYPIAYEVTEGTATILDNKIIFDCDSYEKVEITAAANDCEKVFYVVYVNPAVELIKVNEGANELTLSMPEAMFEQRLDIAFGADIAGLADFAVERDAVEITVDGITDTGVRDYIVRVNGEEYATVRLNVRREVEKIQNVTQTVESSKEIVDRDGVLYTSAKEIAIGYTLYPGNATTSEADISVVSGPATVEGNVIRFTEGGLAQIRLSADNRVCGFDIYSTFEHPDEDTRIAETIAIDKGDTVLYGDLIENIAPKGADGKFVGFENASSILSGTSNGFKALCGGDTVITAKIETLNGTITRDIRVRVSEEPTSVGLNRNYFVVENSNSCTIADSDYSILPATANTKLSATISSPTPGVDIRDNKIIYNGVGEIKVKISLENGVSNEMTILFAGNHKIVDLSENVVELPVNTEFVPRIPASVSQNYDGVGNCAGLTYDNGIIRITETVESEDEEYCSSIDIAGHTYRFKGIVPVVGVSIELDNGGHADYYDGGYVTALKSVKLNGRVDNPDATYRGLRFESSDEEIATVDGTGKVTFNKAGSVTVYVISDKHAEIRAGFAIRGTFGYADRIAIAGDKITLDYNDVNKNSVDIKDRIDIFPSQADVDSNCKLESDDHVAAIDGFTLTAQRGGESIVRVLCRTADNVWKENSTISVSVCRKAENIILDGETLDSDKSVTVDKGYIVLETKFSPEDANVGNLIETEIISGNDDAELHGNVLLFVNADKPVGVRFRMGEVSYVVTYRTTLVVSWIDVDSDPVIVPVENDVILFSSSGKTFETSPDILTTVSAEDGQYRAVTSGKYTLTVDGIEKPLIVTQNVSDAGRLTITDYRNETGMDEDVVLDNNGTHSTASTRMNVRGDAFSAYDSEGRIVEVELSVTNSDVATIENGVLTFKKAGTAKIAAVVDTADFYGPYVRQNTFNVTSTYRTSTDFSADVPAEIVDQNEIVIDGIDINAPAYGGDEVVYTVVTNDVFELDGDRLTVLKTGSGTVTVSSGNTTNKYSVRVDKNIDYIDFKDGEDKILCGYTNESTYKPDVCLGSLNTLEPSLRDVKYEISEGAGATVSPDGSIAFTADYARLTLKVTSIGNGVSDSITVVKVPSHVEIVKVYPSSGGAAACATAGGIVLDNTHEYKINVVGKPFSNEIPSTNAEVLNAETGTFRFVSGGEYSYTVNGADMTVTVEESVDRIIVSTDSVLTAESEIDLNRWFEPVFEPATAYERNGAVTISYSLKNGSATLDRDVLTFASPGTAAVIVKAGEKSIEVAVESTCGYVKSASWLKSGFECRLSDNNYAIQNGDYDILPSDCPTDRVGFGVADTDIATISDGVVTFVRGGITRLVLTYETQPGTTEDVSVPFTVHNPITDFNFVRDNVFIDRLLSNEDCGIDWTASNKDVSSPYETEYVVSDDTVADIDNEGNVSFKQINRFVDITLKIVNSDGSEVSKVLSVCRTDRRILQIDEGTASNAGLTIEHNERAALYALVEDNGDMSYSVIEGDDVLSVDADGFITVSKGGEAGIRICRRDSEYKSIKIYVHRKSDGITTSVADNLYTFAKDIDLGVNVIPGDSIVNKTIKYTLSNPGVAKVEDGVLKFSGAGETDVTIEVSYNENVECTKTIHVRSSFGSVENFHVTDPEGNEIGDISFENIGTTLSFVISGTVPGDFVLNEQSYTVAAQDEGQIEIIKSDTGFTIKALSRSDNGRLVIAVGDKSKSINYTIVSKVTNITAVSNGMELLAGGDYLTMFDELTIEFAATPMNANNANVTVTVSNGGSYDSATNVLSLPAPGKYNITAESTDGGGISKSFNITETDQLDVFTLRYEDKRLSSDEPGSLDINPAYNESGLIVEFVDLPANLIGEINMDKVSVTCSENMSFAKATNEIRIDIPVFSESNPAFNGEFMVQMGTKSVSGTIERDGIRSIEFIDHDNNMDTNYGLQQMRLFGKRSYYDGGVKNYYRLPVKVLPAITGITPKFAATDSSGNVLDNIPVTYDNGVAQIDFTGFVGSSLDEIKNDDFGKTVTITASDLSGKINCSYVFHIVNDGVNVFDGQGFTNAGGQVVLHTNLGGTEEAGLSKYSLYDNTNANGKSIIYGNGFIINYYAYNNTFKKKIGGANNLNTGVGNAINVNLKGGNFSDNKDGYHNNFGGSCFLYSYIQQTYKGTWAGDGQVVKNCYFRYIKDMSIQISDSDRKVYVENIISIDGGNAALEYQKGAFYLKGFIDVYNFKNKKALKDFAVVGADRLIKEIKDKNGGRYVDNVNGEVFVNVVIASGKDKNFSIPVYFWDETTGTYVANEATSSTATDMERITKEILPGTLSVTIFTYPVGPHPMGGDFTYAHQQDNEYLAKQEEKLTRTFDGVID